MGKVTTEVLVGPRLKVQRANRHLDELISLSSPLHSDFYEIVLEDSGVSGDPQNPRFKLTYRPKKPIAKAFALIIGDAIHNLRTALDHLATGIVRMGVPGSSDIYFPFHEFRKNLIASPSLQTIEQALPGAHTIIIDEIQPDNRNIDFWAITKLDVADKHNLILPTVAVTFIQNFNANVANNFMSGGTIQRKADEPSSFIISDVPISVEQNYNTSADIKFGQGRFFENDPVIPKLTQMSNLVSKALDSFERLITT